MVVYECRFGKNIFKMTAYLNLTPLLWIETPYYLCYNLVAGSITSTDAWLDSGCRRSFINPWSNGCEDTENYPEIKLFGCECTITLKNLREASRANGTRRCLFEYVSLGIIIEELDSRKKTKSFRIICLLPNGFQLFTIFL